ncbi:MAG: 2-C-methyl-D-erythritol 4-phosphate cytidylyltransferase [Clostridiaceae bacterium]|nr:2-C-methyl-D-erythritol 4-phosphate cytidylyltransferase [Clostridiaceae bacterium]MBW4859669.1 2-C-methyl-D-erythritol 4-phosphate cytidylyltransferase [Clostridiaceae bacterium]MBW4868790.1 2-C-methyl-D-erythritol 4-phosphate cytidylyltransferase [Clostridiaceae bacterium]
MNIALIFAGGTGTRMNSKTKPKQFLELHGKSIIIYTLEAFENHKEIDAIVVVCLESWIDYLENIIDKASLKKVKCVVPGGKTAQESQYNGLKTIKKKLNPDDETIVLIHDGVRPLIDAKTISKNIQSVKKNGSAITVTPAIETVIMVDEESLLNKVLDRSSCRMAKAPQSFYLKDILTNHEKAIDEGQLDFIDSASLMMYYGHNLHTVEGLPENIKITTPSDFYIFRAICEAKENMQIFG